MARINKSQLTKLEIIQVASDLFLEKGYSDTTAKAICNKLGMSTGNLTFYFPTKEDLLAVLAHMLCDFQWKMMEKEADEGVSSIMAFCLELTAMAAMSEMDEIAKDLYLAAYTSPVALEIIRRNDAIKAKSVFNEYCKGWTDEQFAEAETLVSGIEYATLMTTAASPSLQLRISGALNQILMIYGVPEDLRNKKINKVLDMDYTSIGARILNEFKKYVEKTNEQAFEELFKSIRK